MAVEAANPMVSATSAAPRAMRRRCRCRLAATVSDSPPESGRMRPGNEYPAATDEHAGEPIAEESSAGPEQGRAGEGPVADRDRGDTFDGEDELVSVARGEPEHQRSHADQDSIQTEAHPSRVAPATNGEAGIGNGDLSRIAQCRECNADGGDDEADSDCSAGPDDRCVGGRTESRGSECDPSDERREHEAESGSDDPDKAGFGDAQADELAGGGPSGPQQRLFTAAAVSTGCGDCRGEESGEDRAGGAEEEEQHLRVERVAAGAGEGGAEVVADQARRRRGVLRGCGPGR